MLREREKLPSYMRTEAVRPYYESLKKKEGSLFLKRVFDFTVSLVMLILLLPVLLILAAMIAVDSRGGVFYRQKRVTRMEKVLRKYRLDGKVIIRHLQKNLNLQGVRRFCPTEMFPQIAPFWPKLIWNGS